MDGQNSYNDDRAGRSPSPQGGRGRSRSPDRRPMEEDRQDRGRPSGGDVSNPGNNLHVSGLSSRTTDEDLTAAFSKYGRIAKAQVMKDPHSGDARGFAFVTMESQEEADAAIAGLNATELNGRAIVVSRARRGRARTPTPGQYHGPPKRDVTGGRGGRYDDRRGYSDRGYDRYDDRRGGGYDDRRGGGYYDDRRGGYEDRYSRDSRGGGSYDNSRYDYGRRDDYRSSSSYAQPMRDDRSGGYQGASASSYDQRRY